jgi:hypothetical protein
MEIAVVPDRMARIRARRGGRLPVPTECRRAAGEADLRAADSARESLFVLPVDIVISIY